MGCPTNVVCITCKTNYYCGYGSYGLNDKRAKLFDSTKHEGHEFFQWDSDHSAFVGNDLHVSHMWTEDEPMIVGYRSFKKVDLIREG